MPPEWQTSARTAQTPRNRSTARLMPPNRHATARTAQTPRNRSRRRLISAAKANARANRTDTEKQEQRAAHAAAQARNRANRTDTEKQEQRAADAAAKATWRANRTPEQRKTDRHRMRAHYANRQLQKHLSQLGSWPTWKLHSYQQFCWGPLGHCLPAVSACLPLEKKVTSPGPRLWVGCGHL